MLNFINLFVKHNTMLTKFYIFAFLLSCACILNTNASAMSILGILGGMGDTIEKSGAFDLTNSIFTGLGNLILTGTSKLVDAIENAMPMYKYSFRNSWSNLGGSAENLMLFEFPRSQYWDSFTLCLWAFSNLNDYCEVTAAVVVVPQLESASYPPYIAAADLHIDRRSFLDAREATIGITTSEIRTSQEYILSGKLGVNTKLLNWNTMVVEPMKSHMLTLKKTGSSMEGQLNQWYNTGDFVFLTVDFRKIQGSDQDDAACGHGTMKLLSRYSYFPAEKLKNGDTTSVYNEGGEIVSSYV